MATFFQKLFQCCQSELTLEKLTEMVNSSHDQREAISTLQEHNLTKLKNNLNLPEWAREYLTTLTEFLASEQDQAARTNLEKGRRIAETLFKQNQQASICRTTYHSFGRIPKVTELPAEEPLGPH